MPRTRRPSRSAATRAPRRPGRRGAPQLRVRVGLLVIAMVLSVFGARLVQLQALDPDHYAALAAKEGTISVVLPAERGDILDRNGQPLAVSVKGAMVVANPEETGGKRAPQLARFLAKKLGVDYFATLEKLRVPEGKPGSSFQYVARRVPSTLATAVVDQAERLKYEGLSTRPDPVRSYPGHDIAANLIGFLGTDEALAGLEQSFDKQLSGKDGHERYEVGGQGNQIPLGTSSRVAAVNGSALHLTIDRDLQWYTQRVLRQAVDGAGADSGTALIMDSQTGEILSLADDPTLDADDPGAAKKRNRGARSLSSPYEPGSVEKVLTLSSLIDAGKVTDRTRLVVPPNLVRDGTVIHDYFEHGDLKLTLAGVLAKSSNIGTVLAADRFRSGQLRDYLTRFGLGQKTDIGLAGESAGNVPPPNMWTSETEDRIDFGQALSVNAVQMAAAVNTIANGGVRVSPSLVQGVATENDGTKVGTGTTTSRRVVSKEAARQTTLMMERTVDPEDGVAPLAQVPGYIVAGKTGTAQRVGKACGCYDGTFTVSFAGFAPAQKPRFTIYVVIQNPRNGGGGGSVAGPVFSKLMAYTLQRYGVAPSKRPQVHLPVTW